MRLLSRFKNKNEIAHAAVAQTKYYAEDVRRITPTIIEEFEDHLLIDKEVYATCIIVGVPPSKTGRGFPRNLAPDFTDQILELEATGEYLIGISYSCAPVPHEEAQDLVDDALFKNKISRTEIDKKTQQESGTSAHSLRYDIEGNDYVDIYHRIYNNETRLHDCQYIITLWAESLKGLKNGISRIKGPMNSNISHMEVPYYKILDTYMAAQPYPILSEKAEIQQISEDCGQLIPLRDPVAALSNTGLIYGERKADKAPYIIDWDSLAAAHHIIIGATRSGKTVLLMKLLMGGYSLLGWNFFYVTPKPDNRTDYLAVADYYQDAASVINIGKNKGDQNINPLQVMIDSNVDYLDDAECVNKFNDHLDLLMSFFRVLDTSDVMDNYVLESVIEIYKRYKIIRKDPATWKNIPGDKWPVLADLRELWKEDAKNKNVSAIAMVARTTWLETTCEYISRPTDVKFNKPITIVDLSGVPIPLQSAMNVLVVGLIGARFKTPRKKPTMVIIDEGRVFLNDAKISELIMRMYTQGGSGDLYTCFTTQQAGDISTKETKELFQNNAFVKVAVGNAQPQSYKMIQDFFGLSDHDMQEYIRCGQGQGLVMVNNTVTPVDFALTDLESDVILGTNKNTIKARHDSGFVVLDKRILPLAEEHDTYINDWIDGDPKSLSPGRDRHTITRAFKPGTTSIWIGSSKVKDGKIMNQTIDHYATVLQIASYLLHRGATVNVNHHDDADVVAEINGRTIAVEYERPRSHTTQELIEKNQRAQKQYDKVLFVCTSTNYKQLASDKCIGQNQTAARGSMLLEHLDNLIYDAKQVST